MNENTELNIINWFPGHMAKAKRELIEKVKLVDLVIELRDARIPYSSSNPMLKDIIGNKPKLIILCKAKMADRKDLDKFLLEAKNNNEYALDVDLVDNYNLNKIKNYISLASKDLLLRRKSKGIINKEIRIMVLGIPNVGKSTFINKLTKKNSLNVGNRPGITKSTNVWIKLTNEYLLLDTPGILWPKIEDTNVGYKLALCGTIKDEILPIDSLTYYAVNFLKNYYPELLKNRYNLEELKTTEEIIDDIAKNRGCLRKGGEIDYTKCYKLILQDVKNAKIGAISYDK